MEPNIQIRYIELLSAYCHKWLSNNKKLNSKETKEILNDFQGDSENWGRLLWDAQNPYLWDFVHWISSYGVYFLSLFP